MDVMNSKFCKWGLKNDDDKKITASKISPEISMLVRLMASKIICP